MRGAIMMLFFASSASAAQAGWQWTEWGMSQEELVATMPMPFRQSDMQMPYEAEGMKFGVTFRIRGEGLEAVTLYLDPGQSCPALQRKLLTIYGPDRLGNSTLWDDEKNGTLVAFERYTSDHCAVVYRPLHPPGASGGL